MNRPFGTTRTTKIRLALTNTLGQTVYGPTDQQGLFRAHPFPNWEKDKAFATKEAS